MKFHTQPSAKKTSLDNTVKFWWTSIISVSLSTVCKIYKNSLKVPISSTFLFSYLILYFMEWTSAKNLDKKRFGYECLKTWKSYFLAVDPCRWSQHQHAQSCDEDSGTCDFRLDLSRFSVNLYSCSMQNAPFFHVVWTIKLNLQR